MMIHSIESVRHKIMEIDEGLVQLLRRRMALVLEIGRLKDMKDLPVLDEIREKKVMDHIRNIAHDPLQADELESIFQLIIDICRNAQIKNQRYPGRNVK